MPFILTAYHSLLCLIQVFNKGPGIVHESVVTISFPYEVANGKWLLYMTHEPTVEDNKGRCEIDPFYVNELKIKVCGLFTHMFVSLCIVF